MTDQFELSGDPPVKRSRSKALVKSDGSTQRLMDIYRQEHEKRFGVSPMLGTTYGHAAKILKELKDELTEDGAADVIRRFIWSKDPKIEGGGYTVKELKWHAPRLRIRATGRVASRNDVLAYNLEEAERVRQVKR